MPKFGLELDSTRNIIVSSVSESEKDLPEEEEDGDSYERGENADDLEIDRNPYEGQVEKEDIDEFLQGLNEKISEKAEELGVNGENEMKLFKQKVFWLAKLDLKNTDDETFTQELEAMKLNNGGLDFLKDTILDAVEDVHIDRKGKMVADNFSVIDKAIELMRKHKKIFNIGALTLYLSTFGSGILKPLSGDHAKIIMDDNGIKEDGKNGTNSAGLGVAVQENNSGNDTDMGGANSTQLAGIFNQYEKEKHTIGKTDGTQSLEAFEKFEEENFTANNKDGSIGNITAEELMENPEMITLINESRDENSPINVLRQASDIGGFEYKDVKFSFVVEKGNVWIRGLSGNASGIEQDLQKDGLSFDTMKNSGYPLETFLEKEDIIVGAMAKHLGVPESNLEFYTDRVLMLDTSKIEVVKFKDFNIPTDKDNPETIKLKNAKEEIYKKYGLDSFGQIIVDESLQKQIDDIVTNDAGLVDARTQEERDKFLKSIEEQRLSDCRRELSGWLNENDYEYADYRTEMKGAYDSSNDNLKLQVERLGANETGLTVFANNEEFKDMFLKDLKKAGYTLPELEDIAKKDPKRVIEIVAKTVDDNMQFDKVEAKYSPVPLPNHPKVLAREKKHKSLPTASLGTHAGVCQDYAITMAVGLDVLKSMGISNMDNYAVLGTTVQCIHEYILLATYEDDHIKIALIDPTFADFPGHGLDAADKEHRYHGISKEVFEKYKEKLEDKEKKQIEQNSEEIKEDQDKEEKEEKLKKHNEILKRIQYRNFLVFQQEIIDMIKYDPKATRGRKIIVDEESYRNIRQRERQKVMEVRKQIAQDGEDKK